MKSSTLAIKSMNVVLEDNSEPIEAIILIENQKILDVIIPKETDPTVLSHIYETWNVVDYEELVIFPGLIDSNVHLHADFEHEWENVSYCTDLAASGGVTMIVDNPTMCKPYASADDYLNNLNQRINTIQTNSKVDFGVFGILDPQTVDSTTEILDTGVLGLKSYLISCFGSTVGNFQLEAFRAIARKTGTETSGSLGSCPSRSRDRPRNILYISLPNSSTPK